MPDNAYGHFLAGLAGEDDALLPSGKNGRTQVLSLAPREHSPGESSTLNTSPWHNDASVCLLSEVLEMTSIPLRYFLSSTACEGILRRAEARGKKLPERLRVALEHGAERTMEA
jgi:hypothetical protein